MGLPIFHSQYTAAQIEAALGKGPRVNSSGFWEVWNIATGAYESTGVGAGVKAPTVVSQASQMTNQGYIYIYNGSESGYQAGYWYYWNGSAWTAGGAYQVAATDKTLAVSDAAADAKVTGDKIGELKSAIEEYNSGNFIAIYGNHASGTNNGVAYSWVDSETVKLNNTATGNMSFTIFNSSTVLPNWLKIGKSYIVKISRTKNVPLLRIVSYVGASSTNTDFSTDGIYTVPTGCTGVLFQFRGGSSGTAYNNDTVKMAILSAPSNAELQSEIDDLTAELGTTNDAVSDIDSVVKELNTYNAKSVIPDASRRSGESNGIIFTWDSNDVCTVSGLATGNAFNNIVANQSALPANIKPGGTYWFEFTSTDSSVAGEIYYYESGSESGIRLGTYTETTQVTIPVTAIGLTVRLFVASGQSPSGTATIDITDAPSNQQLAEMIEDNIGTNNYYSFTTNQNSYNVTASPEITTDTNNYLAASGNNADRTADIQAVLAAGNVCHLGPGNFFTTGITLSEGQTLTGCGKATRLYLANSVTNGAAVTMGSDTTLKDLDIRGPATVTVSATVGTRHGVLIAGNASGSGDSIPTRITISGVYISRLNGGAITFYDTGLSTPAAALVSDVHIWDCDAGINISYFSEFNQFVNVTARGCYYGCVDNGGNNIFSNCNFSGNKVGLLMDNSSSQSPNNSHGGFANCIFDHSDSNNGTGIKILNNNAGEMFTGCQVFYSKIEIDSSSGIVMEAFNFGNAETITISGGGAITFANCMFGTAPTISVTDNTHVNFVNCYTRAGDAVTAA